MDEGQSDSGRAALADRVGPERLLDYAAECRALDRAGFRRRHGEAFLVHRGTPEALDAERGLSRTRTGGGDTQAGAAYRLRAECRVFPIRSARHKASAHIISVGRAAANDLVLPHEGITKYHAFFKRGEDGRIFLLDGASKNGTFLDDRPVPMWGQGDPVEVASGMRVRLGTVEFTFLAVAELYELVRRLTASDST